LFNIFEGLSVYYLNLFSTIKQNEIKNEYKNLINNQQNTHDIDVLDFLVNNISKYAINMLEGKQHLNWKDMLHPQLQQLNSTLNFHCMLEFKE
jgi:hypothetical protein